MGWSFKTSGIPRIGGRVASCWALFWATGKRGKAKSTSLAESRCAKDSADLNIYIQPKLCGFGDKGHATKWDALLFFQFRNETKTRDFHTWNREIGILLNLYWKIGISRLNRDEWQVCVMLDKKWNAGYKLLPLPKTFFVSEKKANCNVLLKRLAAFSSNLFHSLIHYYVNDFCQQIHCILIFFNKPLFRFCLKFQQHNICKIMFQCHDPYIIDYQDALFVYRLLKCTILSMYRLIGYIIYLLIDKLNYLIIEWYYELKIEILHI